MTTPEKMRSLRDYPGGSAWIDTLPRLVEECREQWSLRLGERYEYAFVSLALRADLPDGTPAVLKIGFPHRESEHEPDALLHYDGRGAVRLLDVDRERDAMLLERCEPGTPLSDLGDARERYATAAGVIRRLWRPVAVDHSFRPIADDAERWIVQLPQRYERLGRPFERALLDEALSAFEELAPTQGELVVCHQDFHPGNVLRAEREPWLAIDPKPVAAEREFDTASLLRDDPREIRWRLDFLAAELDLDRERMRRWALAHKLAWSFDESDPEEKDIEVVRALIAAAS